MQDDETVRRQGARRPLLFDLGDTIMIEATEVKDAEGTTTSAALIPGMAEALRYLKVTGHPLALVADTRPSNPRNVLGPPGLYELFDYCAISEVVGASKPDPLIFKVALDALGIERHRYPSV